MPLGPFIGRSPEACDDQCMDRLDSSVEGYLVAEADGGEAGSRASRGSNSYIAHWISVAHLRLRNALHTWHIVCRERPEDEAVRSCEK